MNINDLIGRLQSQREANGFDCKVSVIGVDGNEYHNVVVCGSPGRITMYIEPGEDEDDDADDEPSHALECNECGMIQACACEDVDFDVCAVCGEFRKNCECDDFAEECEPKPPDQPCLNHRCGGCGGNFEECECPEEDAK